MNMVVDLNLAYRQIVVSAKDFITLTEIMERAKFVDRRWLDNGDRYVLVDRERRLVAEQLTSEPMTQYAFDELRRLEEVKKAEAQEPTEEKAAA